MGMRAVWLWIVGLAGIGFAQNAPPPHLPKPLPRVIPRYTPQQRAVTEGGVCSIPLVPMRVPPGVRFPMKRVTPRTGDAIAKVPPAPPCRSDAEVVPPPAPTALPSPSPQEPER